MLACPACSTPLRSDHDHRGMCWSCRGCGGELFTTTSLKSVRADILADLQRAPRLPRAEPVRACSLCRQGMVRIHGGGPPPLPLDVCDRCRVVWFDRTEYAAVFPSRATKPPSGAPPPKPWPRTFIPWMTYAVMLACIVASCWVWFTDRTLMHDWGYQPSNPWRHGGLTALTCFFLHLHPLHLLGNMLALWSFGEEVEETLGRLWLLVMLTLATIAGCAMYGLVHADPSTPCIGASGGISGVLTYFCASSRESVAQIWLR